MNFREDGPSTPASHGQEGWVHEAGLLPAKEPEREMGGKAETSWGAPRSAKHTACVNPKMSLQRRKLQRETSNLAVREEQHKRRKEKAGLVGVRGLVPHILFLFHSVPLLPPKPGGREQTKLAGGGGAPWGLARD